MKVEQSSHCRGSRGQSLVETAIMLPLLLMVVLNVVNFAYFFLVIINLTGTVRSAALYSILGSATPYAAELGPSGPGVSSCTSAGNLSVAYVAQQDMCGALTSNPGTGVSIQVCSTVNLSGGSGVNGSGTTQKSNCVTCTGSSACTATASPSPPLDADPEAPNFVLNQVSVTYTFNPLIPGKIFNIPLQAFSGICTSGSCTFTRRAEMRSMN